MSKYIGSKGLGDFLAWNLANKFFRNSVTVPLQNFYGRETSMWIDSGLCGVTSWKWVFMRKSTVSMLGLVCEPSGLRNVRIVCHVWPCRKHNSVFYCLRRFFSRRKFEGWDLLLTTMFVLRTYRRNFSKAGPNHVGADPSVFTLSNGQVLSRASNHLRCLLGGELLFLKRSNVILQCSEPLNLISASNQRFHC